MTSLEERTTKEVYARHLLLLVMVLLGSWSFAVIFPLFWIAFYTASTFVSWHVLGRLAERRQLVDYGMALGIFALRIFTFRAMMLYLWFGPFLSWQFIALFMLMGSLRFSINPKTRIRSYALITAFADLTTLVVLSGLAILPEPFGQGRLLVGFAAAGLAIYYVITLQEAHKGLLEIEALEEQSRQSQKMEAIGRLTGGFAHDFNNIMTVVNGNLELLDEVDTPTEQRGLLEEARTAAGRASRLTAQLLAFSRQLPMHRDVVDTSMFLDELQGHTVRVLPGHISMRSEIDPDLWPMFVDGVQLEVAVQNLILNARDAMPDGGTITLSTRTETLLAVHKQMVGTRFVVLSISDTGHGLSESMIEKVTEPFFTTKPVGEGSGLGLSMVKGFAEQSGGALHLSSKEGAGTTAAIWIPAAQPNETASDPPSPSPEPDI